MELFLDFLKYPKEGFLAFIFLFVRFAHDYFGINQSAF